MKNTLSLRWVRVARYSLVITAWSGSAWAAPQPESSAGQAVVVNPAALAEATAPVSPVASLSAIEVEGEAVLQVKVSFDVKHRLLSDLLGDLQQQSGVHLTADALSPAGAKRVTAHVKDISLARVMNALTGLYGVVWTRGQSGAYRMLPPNLPKMRVDMLSLGDIGLYHFWQYRVRRHNRPDYLPPLPDWVTEITEQVDRQALRTADGVPVSDLPDDLRNRFRHHVNEVNALALVKAYIGMGLTFNTFGDLNNATLDISGTLSGHSPSGPFPVYVASVRNAQGQFAGQVYLGGMDAASAKIEAQVKAMQGKVDREKAAQNASPQGNH